MASISFLTKDFIKTVALLIFFSVFSTSCTVVKDKEASDKNGEQLDIYFVNDDFNPDVYVEKIWASKIVPFFEDKCLVVDEVLTLWKEDKEAAGEKYGYREKDEGSPWTYKVKGEGKIIEVNTKSRASTIGVDLVPLDDVVDLVVQIGPVIKGSSIRDCLEFISFTDFTNQLEFARLSTAINKHVNQNVLSGLDRENLMDRDVMFSGAFSQLNGSDLVRVTPVILDIK